MFRRGKGPGVTWNCATDKNIKDFKKNCSMKWKKGGKFLRTPSSKVVIKNKMTGEVSWEVTSDLLKGYTNGWLIKKAKEKEFGNVEFYSREGAANHKNLELSPRLILEY